MKPIHSVVLVLVVSLLAGSAQASCYEPNKKLHFSREKDPITQQDILGTTVIGVVGGGVIIGVVGGLLGLTGNSSFKYGFVTGSTIGGLVTGFNAWQELHGNRKFQQRRLRDALFYYLSHPDFADERTTDEERAYVSDLVQSFRVGVQARLNDKKISYNSVLLFEEITAIAQKLDLEEKGCKFKQGRRVVRSIETLQRLVVRGLTDRR